MYSGVQVDVSADCPSGGVAFHTHPSEALTKPCRVDIPCNTMDPPCEVFVPDGILGELDCTPQTLAKTIGEWWGEHCVAPGVYVECGTYIDSYGKMFGPMILAEARGDIVDATGLDKVERDYPGQGQAIIARLGGNLPHNVTPASYHWKDECELFELSPFTDTPAWACNPTEGAEVTHPKLKMINEIESFEAKLDTDEIYLFPLYIYHWGWEEGDNAKPNMWHAVNDDHLHMCECGHESACWLTYDVRLSELKKLAKTINLLAELNHEIESL